MAGVTAYVVTEESCQTSLSFKIILLLLLRVCLLFNDNLQIL